MLYRSHGHHVAVSIGSGPTRVVVAIQVGALHVVGFADGNIPSEQRKLFLEKVVLATEEAHIPDTTDKVSALIDQFLGPASVTSSEVIGQILATVVPAEKTMNRMASASDFQLLVEQHKQVGTTDLEYNSETYPNGRALVKLLLGLLGPVTGTIAAFQELIVANDGVARQLSSTT